VNEVQGARVRSGDGAEISFDAGQTRAFVVDRGALDLEMAMQAADAGAEYRVKAAAFHLGATSVTTRGPGGCQEYSYEILIAADGARSSVARMRGVRRAPVYLAGLQADLAYPLDQRFVEIYPDASPEFFGWAIPIGEGRARVGLAGLTGVKSGFFRIVRSFGSSWTHLASGTIPIGVMPVTYGNRTLFVGDAAGMAKPTSGGGVYTGVRSARHAALIASKCCAEGRFDDKALRAYEVAWKDDFGRELSLGFRLFSVRQKLGPKEIGRLVRSLDRPDVIDAIVKYGDMDRPEALVRHLASKPAFLLSLGRFLGPAIRGLYSGA
jgi:flavin-dependent dehydrogenase